LAAPVLVLLIVPTFELPFAIPLTDQVTLVSGCPALVTLTLSSNIALGGTEDVFGGFVETLIAMSLLTVIFVVPVLDVSA
jgi:hypothetical protein